MKEFYAFIISLLICLFGIKDTFGQFNQFNSTNLLYNASFAGSLKERRLSFNNHIELNSFSLRDNFYIGYDQYVNKLKGGFGVYVSGTHNRYKNNDLKSLDHSLDINFIYAPKFQLGKDFMLSPSLKIGVSETYLTDNNYPYGIYFYPYNFDSADTLSEAINSQYGASASFGLLLSTSKFYLGISSIDNFTWSKSNYKLDFANSNESIDTNSITTSSLNSLPDFSVQVGYNIKLKNKDFSINPVCYTRMGMVDNSKKFTIQSLLLASTLKYKSIEFGAGIGLPGGLIGLIGFYLNDIRVAYSVNSVGYYDSLGRSKGSIGGHEVSLRYLIN